MTIMKAKIQILLISTIIVLLSFFGVQRCYGDANYLCFTAKEGNADILLKLHAYNNNNSTNSKSWEYSYDKHVWITYNIYDTIHIICDQNVYLRAKSLYQTLSTDNICNYYFNIIGKVQSSGNIMSLVDKTCQSIVMPCDWCFSGLFCGCTGLLSAPQLPATHLTLGCYYYMFSGCTNLTSAPELPAIELARACYYGMFNGCNKLLSAPQLPATQIATECYSYMFSGCANLTIAPELPAEDLAEACYYAMFRQCTTLRFPPNLRSSHLAEACYSEMFEGCISLTEAPVLPSKKLKTGCYASMFSGCDSLQVLPKLPAKQMAPYCYQHMFCGCSLIESATLVATRLAEQCYANMFYNCFQLKKASIAVSGALDETECFYEMFNGCANLNLLEVNFIHWGEQMDYRNEPDPEDEDGCDNYGFYCVRDIKCQTYEWLHNVAEHGVFYCSQSLPQEKGASRIPDGWQVICTFAENETIETEKTCPLFAQVNVVTSISNTNPHNERCDTQQFSCVARQHHVLLHWIDDTTLCFGDVRDSLTSLPMTITLEPIEYVQAIDIVEHGADRMVLVRIDEDACGNEYFYMYDTRSNHFYVSDKYGHCGEYFDLWYSSFNIDNGYIEVYYPHKDIVEKVYVNPFRAYRFPVSQP